MLSGLSSVFNICLGVGGYQERIMLKEKVQIFFSIASPSEVIILPNREVKFKEGRYEYEDHRLRYYVLPIT